MERRLRHAFAQSPIDIADVLQNLTGPPVRGPQRSFHPDPGGTSAGGVFAYLKAIDKKLEAEEVKKRRSVP